MINLEQVEQLMASGSLMCQDENGKPFNVSMEMKLELLNHLNQQIAIKSRVNSGSNYTKPKKRKK
jgi:hypothetical protein